MEEREEPDRRRLTRVIDTFVAVGGLHRHARESHTLTLYPPGEVGDALTEAGFGWERLDGYGEVPLLPGWTAFVASAAP